MEAGKLSSGRFPGFQSSLMLMVVLLQGVCAGLPPGLPPPTPEAVVQWSWDKVAPAQIIQRMQDSHAVYRLSGSALAQLRAQGVEDAVIDHLHETHLAAVWREAAAHRFDH